MARRLCILIVMMAFFVVSPYAQQRKTTTKKATTTRVTKKPAARKQTVAKTKKTASTNKKTTTKKATPQSGQASIANLKSQRAKLKKDIEEQQKRYRANERDVKQRLQGLMALNTEISYKKKTIDSIRLVIDTLNMEIRRLDKELAKLKEELADRQDKYVKSVRYMHRNSSAQSQLMFIFSAKNFTQMYRRMRFMREYAGHQRTQGEMVKAKQLEVTNKQNELKATKEAKDIMLKRGENERKLLENKQGEQEKMVATLKKQQKTIQGIITAQQKKDAALNAEIERLIAIEVEKARQRAIAEAKRQTEEAARQAKQALSKDGKKISKKKSEPYRIDSEDRRISGSFASNKGRLPVPVVGPYRVINRFGQYNVEGLKNVRLDNKGINIEVKPGAQVRSIFDGEVSAVFSLAGISGVMIRHGSYISVYCNLTGITVRKGQRVTTRQVIGRVDNTNILEFQLRNEKKTLNPEAWIAR